MAPLDLSLTHLHQAADAGTDAPWLLILLHGVGSNERDLFGLAPHVPARFHVLSLRAPHAMGPSAYGWFTFHVTPQGRQIDTAQEAASRAQLAEAIASAAQQLGVPASRVVVGGFSQGGIMALSLLLTQPRLMHAAMAMHSRLLPEVLPLVAPAAALAGHALWVSAGRVDAVLPVAHAHGIRDFVADLPLALHYEEFDNAHQITGDELSAAAGWLGSLA